MSDDEEDYGIKEFVVGYTQLEQLGPKQREGLEGVMTAIQSGETLVNALRKAAHIRIDPIDRFKILASIYYDKFGGDQSFYIKWETIVAKIPSIKWIRYKNPIGFILGARAFNKDKQLTSARIDLISSAFEQTLNDESITKEDIIRYARYWQTLLA